jgi:hypothetical protein
MKLQIRCETVKKPVPVPVDNDGRSGGPGRKHPDEYQRRFFINGYLSIIPERIGAGYPIAGTQAFHRLFTNRDKLSVGEPREVANLKVEACDV